MTMILSGNGNMTGLVSGGLPDGTVLPADLSTGGPYWDTSGNLQFNSGYGAVATAYGCRAWVNFNGTGTVAIRASGNVSSITDNGTGDYTVNFTTAMPDANYCAVIGASNAGMTARSGTLSGDSAATSGSRRVVFCDYAGTLIDGSDINVSIFR